VDRRLFLWGLSNGVTMLALGGAFWIGLGIGMVANLVHWTGAAVGTMLQIGGSVWLIRSANRRRRRSDSRDPSWQQRHIRPGMDGRRIPPGAASPLHTASPLRNSSF
jgi:hypothetical protein